MQTPYCGIMSRASNFVVITICKSHVS